MGDVGEEEGEKKKEKAEKREIKTRETCRPLGEVLQVFENHHRYQDVVEGESLEFQVDVGRDGVFLWI